VFLADGWFATGDIGKIDEDGFLFITDRKKDLIVTAGGMNIAPQNIENLLKGDPFISQAMVHGDKRPYPVAIITLNPEELAKFAKEQGILNTEPAALAKHPKVVEHVARIVEARNGELQSYAKVKKFAILPVDFTVENGLLTPTLKVKRRLITDKHRELLDSLYR
jgi:long-chain acyl-CoA synthetase